jgi:UDP-MurNAc hydroxylase
MSNAKISLISHASILIQIDDKKIVTDPWYFGETFNNGWELSPKPNLEKIKLQLRDADIIWISHEHPDHLHFPTLKWLVEIIDKNVTIYFQKTNSIKVFSALKKLGYKSFVQMPHMKKITITPKVKIACYAHRHLDSALAVFINNKMWLLNINDTALSTNDCSLILKKFGNPCVIYNQFSIAGSNGIEKSLKINASNILSRMTSQHKELKAKLTVPFASFIRFARTDNTYMNPYANSIKDVQNEFKKTNLNLCVQRYEREALEWTDAESLPINWQRINSNNDCQLIDDNIEDIDTHNYTVVSESELKSTIESKIREWHNVTNPLIWKLFKFQKITLFIYDLGKQIWEIDFNRCLFYKKFETKEADIKIASQPLHQAFKTPFGIQTLGVSGRYKFSEEFEDVPRTWKKIRILSSLFNAEIYFNLRSLFSVKTINWIWFRRKGLLNQILQQVKRFKSNLDA